MARRGYGNRPYIESEGKKTNPTLSPVVVLADTGALAEGLWQVRCGFGASNAATFLLARRNAANDGDVGDVPVLYIPAAATSEILVDFVVEASERIRLTMDADLTGTAAAFLQFEKIG